VPIPGRLRWWGRCSACGLPGLVLACATQAQLSTSIGADSDDRYRGVSLSNSRPSARLTLNYDAPEHAYAGASLTRVTLVGRGSYAQTFGYAGWLSTLADGRSVEIGIDGSHFAGLAGYDFAEAYVAVLAKAWSARAYFAPDYYGQRVRVAYLELNANVAVDEHARLFAHVGVLAPLGAVGGAAGKARGDVSAGMGWVVRGWDIHLAAVAATRGGPYPAVYAGRRAALVGGAAFFF
jgi:uncharacterized protein (TIGR02001 family)